ncbi:hypothetical protein [Castellaniella sp.]|uniref:hypothetical protein n=1 Tax=Castellaniella sp. TaxID=1955812 RepID=UPI003A8CF978
MKTQKRIQTIIATRSTLERRKALQNYAKKHNRKMMDVVNGLIDNLLAGESLSPDPQPKKIEEIDKLVTNQKPKSNLDILDMSDIFGG